MELDLKENPHRRFNPLTREWILVSPNRTERPWLGQVEKSVANTPPRIRSKLLHVSRECASGRRSDRASLEQLLAASLHGFGKIDILINCAGKIKRMPTLTMPEEE